MRFVPAFGAGEVAARAQLLETVAEVQLAVDEEALVVIHQRRLVAVRLLIVALKQKLWDLSIRVGTRFVQDICIQFYNKSS